MQVRDLTTFGERNSRWPILVTWIFFPSYENRFWSQWVYMANFYFLSLSVPNSEQVGRFPFALIFQCTLHFHVNTIACSYGLDRPRDMHYAYTRMQTSSNIMRSAICRHNVHSSSFSWQLDRNKAGRGAPQSSFNLQFTPVLQQHHGLKSLTQQLFEVGFILGMKEGEDPKKIFSFPVSVLVSQILSQIT